MKRFVLILATIALSGCGQESPRPGGTQEPPALTAADIADNNRGVALMGYFDYGSARDVLAELVERQPSWLDARVNLAIATLNRQQQGDETEALAIVTGVLAEQPGHLRAHYVSGLLRLYLGDAVAAAQHFGAVVAADDSDGYAAYYLGQALVQLDRVDEAIEQYRRAMALDPYLRSAYYGAALALRRSGRAEEAAALLADYQRFENNPRARLAEFKYTRMGPKAELRAIDRETPSPPPPPSGPVFEPHQTLAQLPGLGERASMTTVDIDADGDQDLFVTRVGTNAVTVVLVQKGDDWVETDHPLSDVAAVNAVAWGDFDNDGRVDVYLCRAGLNQLWRQDGDAGWTDVTVATATANGSFDCADTLMIDADHDGDLDLFVVNRDGPNELYNNNLDGTFRPLASDHGIAGRSGSRGAIAGDLDNDRDLDLIVIKDVPPHEVFLNDRLWQYRQTTDLPFAAAPLVAATLGDSDTDGLTDVLSIGSDGGVSRWPGNGDAREPLFPAAGKAIALADFDGDGHTDVLHTGSGGWSVHSLTDGRALGFDSHPVVQALAVFDDAAHGPDLVAALADGRIVSYGAGPGRYPFAAFTFSGKEEQADSMRSNRDGLGTRVELRVDSRWTITEFLDRNSGPGQSLQPLMLGLGGAPRADFIALTWPDGVYQTELDLAVAERHAVVETQRQLSSCPVLFVWDGSGFRFVTDVLGVGGLGFFVEPGVSATPRPWEYLLLPEGLPVARDGLLTFKLSEPMEELAYVDAVRLHVYDLPAALSMTLDERMVIAGPPATGKPLFYKTEMLPIQALNQDGRDVTRAVAYADKVAAPVGELDQRFIGRLAGTHTLTLDFAAPLDARPGMPLLIVDGWVEYPYSQTVFAAWQADQAYEAPTLEAFGRDGHWRTVYASFGYPAGMPRQMTLPLADLPPGTMRLRLSTNLEVYWDRIAVAHTVGANPTHRSTAPVAARQRLTGFPLRTTAAQRLPAYDYSRRDSFWDTRYPRGNYSAFGPVLELVNRTDDAVAIIGPGEEVEFAFEAPADPAPGLVRHYVLEVRGWAKDMDLYTRDGGTVGPLPIRDTQSVDEETRDVLHRRFHTRYQSGR